LFLEIYFVCLRASRVHRGLFYSDAHPAFRLPSAPRARTCWALQFIGHYFEGEPPEFFKDWRFLFVGLRWWMAKIRGKA